MDDHAEVLKAKVIRNTGSLIVGRGASLVVSLIPSVLLVRHLGTQSLGEYASLYAFMALFSWLPTFGMDQLLVQQSARDSSRAGRIIGTGIITSALLAAFTFVVASGAALLTGYSSVSPALVVLVGVELLLLTPVRLAGTAYPIKFRQGIAASISVARQVLWAGSVAALVFLDQGVTAFVIARVVCSVVEVALIYVTSARLVRPDFRWSWPEVRGTTVMSAPLALGLVFVSVQQRIDQVMLHSWVGDAELGRYVAAVTITELFAILPAALMSTMLPVLSGAVPDPERFSRLARTCFYYLAIAVFGICVVLTLGSRQLITSLYGSEFVVSSPVLSILVWSLVAIFLGGAMSVLLIARGEQRLIPIGTGVAAGSNILLNLFLIPRYGALGAAWATLVSYSLGNFGVFVMLRATRVLAMGGLRASLAPAGAAVLTGVVGWLLGPSLTLAVLSPIIYLLGLGLLGVWGGREVRSLLAALRFRTSPAP